MQILIGGHRGSGCTDSPHARTMRPKHGISKPAENTLESIHLALRNGANLIEVDVIQTLDNKLVITHSNALADHVFNVPNPGFVADHTYEELAQLRVGPDADTAEEAYQEALKAAAEPYAEERFQGVMHHTPTPPQIPLLGEVLDACKDVILNLEIKDVKGTPTAKFQNGRPLLVDLLAEELRTHIKERPKAKIILSSFSLWDLTAMKERLPELPRGQLFDSSTCPERPIYEVGCKDPSSYMPFTPANIDRALAEADITYVHPCIDSLTEATIAYCADKGLKLNTWALYEGLPADDMQRLGNTITLCRLHKVSLGIITDYVPQMHTALKKLLP